LPAGKRGAGIGVEKKRARSTSKQCMHCSSKAAGPVITRRTPNPAIPAHIVNTSHTQTHSQQTLDIHSSARSCCSQHKQSLFLLLAGRLSGGCQDASKNYAAQTPAPPCISTNACSTARHAGPTARRRRQKTSFAARRWLPFLISPHAAGGILGRPGIYDKSASPLGRVQRASRARRGHASIGPPGKQSFRKTNGHPACPHAARSARHI
jgi:hypothetical protein